MAFDANRLALTVDSIGGGSLRIHFLRTTDDRDAVTATNYVRFARRLGLREGDVVIVHDETAAGIDASTYITRVSDISAEGHATLVADVGDDVLPPNTFRANDGDGSKYVTYGEARVLLDIEKVTNKSEAELAASGPIGEALALKAADADLKAGLARLSSEVGNKVTLADVNQVVDPVKDRVGLLEAGQGSNRVTTDLWSKIAGLPPSASVTYEVLDGDTGSHAGVSTEAGYDPQTGLVPNAGIYNASGDPLAIRRIGPTSAATAAAQVSRAIGPTTFPLNERFGFVLRDRITGELADLDNPDSIKFIQEIAVKEPYPYDFKASGEYGKTPVTAVAEATDGLGIGRLTFKNQSDTAYATIAFGEDAEHLGSGSDTYGPGSGYTYEPPPTGRVSVVTNGDAVPVTLRYWRSVDADPNSPARAAAHLARFGGTMTEARRTAIGDFYIALLEAGWISLCAGNGSIWVGRAPNNFDGLIDWANAEKTFGRATINSSAPPDTSFAGTVFNGNNAIDTLVNPPASALNMHSLFVASDTADAASNKVATGNSGIRVAPNRTGTVTTLYTGGGSLLVTAGGRGGLQGYTRSNNAGIRFYRNATLKSDIAEVADDANLGSPSIYIGALHALGGLTFGYTGMLDFQAQTFGVVPSDAMVDKLDAALTNFRNAVGA